MKYTIPKPGSRDGCIPGPCEHRCTHVACTALRDVAARECPICNQPLGFGVALVDDGHMVVHGQCVGANDRDRDRVTAAWTLVKELRFRVATEEWNAEFRQVVVDYLDNIEQEVTP